MNDFIDKNFFWRKKNINKSVDFKKINTFIDKINCKIIHNGNFSFYVKPSPEGSFPNHISGDYIRMPSYQQFYSFNEYYFNLFHEISHWSEIRLNLNLDEFKSELVAEIVSNLLCNKFQIQISNQKNCDIYLNKWINEVSLNENYIKDSYEIALKIVKKLNSFQRN